MSLVYTVNVLEELKKKGITTYKIRKEHILGQATLTKLRNKEPITWSNINTICELLNCQPNDFLKYVPTKDNSDSEK